MPADTPYAGYNNHKGEETVTTPLVGRSPHALTRADRTHLNRALRLAELSTCRQRHGAVIAQGRRVLAVGVNAFRSHPSTVTDPKSEASFHAEVAVLRALKGNPSPSTLYVARIDKSGLAALSKPCPRCCTAIAQSTIERVVYSTDGGGYGILEVRG